MLQPRASMSLLMCEIMRSHSSSSEGPDWSSELPAAPLPLVVELEVVLSVRLYLPKLSVMMPRPSFTPMVSRKFSKCWLSFSGMKGRRPGAGGIKHEEGESISITVGFLRTDFHRDLLSWGFRAFQQHPDVEVGGVVAPQAPQKSAERSREPVPEGRDYSGRRLVATSPRDAPTEDKKPAEAAFSELGRIVCSASWRLLPSRAAAGTEGWLLPAEPGSGTPVRHPANYPWRIIHN